MTATQDPATPAEPSNATLAGRWPVPSLGPPPRPKQATFAERMLPSGLAVVAVRRPSVPLVEIRLRIPFGGTAPSHPARSRLLGDTILAGTTRHSQLELAEAVQALGGNLTAVVDADRLMLGGAVLKTGLADLLDLLAEVLAEASYPSGEVAIERDRLVEQLSIARSQPNLLAREALRRRMFGDHPYAREIPVAEAVASTTPAQLRKLHASRMLPAGAVLVLVGDLQPKRALDRIEAALGEWKPEGAARGIPPLPQVQPAPTQLAHRAGSVQSSIRLGGTALHRDDREYPALQLANLAFGGYFSSRLVENIREAKGYTYSPHSRVEHGVAGSTVMVDADVATEVTAPALLEIGYELGRMVTLPISEQELADVRQYAISSLAISTSTQAGLASMLATLAGAGLGLEWLREHPVRLTKVTREDVFEVAQRLLAPAALVTVILGDADQVVPGLEPLGPVELA